MAKILIIGQFENPIVPGKYAGGTERAEQLQAFALANAGHKVSLVTIPTSFKPKNYNLLFINPQANAPRICENIAKVATYYDLVISHAKRPGTVKGIAQIPNVVHVLHVMPSIFGIVGVGLMEGMRLGYMNGHRIHCVSKYHRTQTIQYMLTRSAFQNKSFDIDPRPFPQLVIDRHTKVLRMRRNPPVAIGRMHPEKQLDLARDAGFTVYATHPNQEFPEARCGLPYRALMGRLACASVNVSTWPHETMGRTPFEAACRGVPSVIHSKKGEHASAEYLPKLAKIVIDSHKVRRTLIPGMLQDAADILTELPLAYRQKLADEMWEKYNYYKHQADLLEILEL